MEMKYQLMMKRNGGCIDGEPPMKKMMAADSTNSGENEMVAADSTESNEIEVLGEKLWENDLLATDKVMLDLSVVMEMGRMKQRFDELISKHMPALLNSMEVMAEEISLLKRATKQNPEKDDLEGAGENCNNAENLPNEIVNVDEDGGGGGGVNENGENGNGENADNEGNNGDGGHQNGDLNGEGDDDGDDDGDDNADDEGDDDDEEEEEEEEEDDYEEAMIDDAAQIEETTSNIADISESIVGNVKIISIPKHLLNVVPKYKPCEMEMKMIVSLGRNSTIGLYQELRNGLPLISDYAGLFVCINDYKRDEEDVGNRFGDRGAILSLKEWDRLCGLGSMALSLQALFRGGEDQHLFHLDEREEEFLLISNGLGHYPFEVRKMRKKDRPNADTIKLLKTVHGHRLTRGEFIKLQIVSPCINDMIKSLLEESRHVNMLP